MACAVSACGLFATGAATILLTEQLRALRVLDLTKLPGPVRQLPTVVGLSFYAVAIARAPISRRAVRCVLVLSLLPIILTLVLNGAANQAGPFAIAALSLDAFALFGSTLPVFTGFWDRQRAKRSADERRVAIDDSQ
jgi:hypothetical protein